MTERNKSDFDTIIQILYLSAEMQLQKTNFCISIISVLNLSKNEITTFLSYF